MNTHTLTLPKPDDAHLHLRAGAALLLTVPHAAAQFSRAIIMPNLETPITQVAHMSAYRQQILDAVPRGSDFDPLMTLYLNSDVTAATLKEANEHEYFLGCKLYPQGVTTHAQKGVKNLKDIEPLLETMEKLQIPLLIHGEIPDPTRDIFDREKAFIDEVLIQWITRFPTLKISLEHITTRHAVQFIESARPGVGASITAHHLLLNRNDLLSGGIRPDYYCLPILKRSSDQAALLQAATSKNPKFYLGTDSAPHAKSKKYSACGCAGIYTAHAALECYAMAFDKANRLDALEDFILNVSRFYGLPLPKQTATLIRQSHVVPTSYPFAGETLIPFWAGQKLNFFLLPYPSSSD